MEYEYWLACMHGVTNQRKKLIREVYGNARNLYYIEERRLEKMEGYQQGRIVIEKKDIEQIIMSRKRWNLAGEYQKLKDMNIQFFPWFSKEFPIQLLDISNPPYALYVKGHLPEDNLPSVAIVGARKCTAYGERYAWEFAKELAQYGVQILSGLARGIDGISQRGALDAGGKTYAVLGCGVDICYPREHIGLYSDILEHGGGILSEWPIGTKPLAIHFPLRNRIISGLSNVTLVMEAKLKSGSLITADAALEQGKDVYALPGPINSVLSEGCNHLIRQGAGILLSPQDLLEELKIKHNKMEENEEENKIKLESAEKLVYSCLDFSPKSLTDIMNECDLSVSSLMDTLMGLELKGLVGEVSKNYYRK